MEVASLVSEYALPFEPPSEALRALRGVAELTHESITQRGCAVLQKISRRFLHTVP